jgi:hypothetical protein
MWGLWHTGTLFWKEVLTSSLASSLSFAAIYLLQYLLLVVPLSIIYAFLMQGSKGSLLLAVLLHASYNLTITVAASAWPDFPMLTLIVLIWVLAGGLSIRLWHAPARTAAPRTPNALPVSPVPQRLPADEAMVPAVPLSGRSAGAPS